MKAFSLKGLAAVYRRLGRQRCGNLPGSAAFVFSLITLIALASLVTPPSFGQTVPNSTDVRFYDDLLDHFVGKWEVTSTVYGRPFTLDREAEWVLNHQYLRIHEKSREVIPSFNGPFEQTLYIGYSHRSKRYVVHELTVHGTNGPTEPEGFSYAYRTGNELKIVFMKGSDVVAIGRHTWEPASRSWHNVGRQVSAGGEEQEPHVIAKAVSAKPASK
jgi:hypothetical protein